MKKDSKIGLLHKIWAVKNSEDNATKIKQLSGLSYPVWDQIQVLYNEIDKAISYYLAQKPEILRIGKECL